MLFGFSSQVDVPRQFKGFLCMSRVFNLASAIWTSSRVIRLRHVVVYTRTATLSEGSHNRERGVPSANDHLLIVTIR